MSSVGVPDAWTALLPMLRGGPPHVMAVGAVDAGKSTLCRWLAEALALDQDTWLVDADLGQSQLGPPASIGCGKAGSPRVSAEHAFFVGDVSPASCLAACLGAFARATRSVEQAGARRMVVDTSGWVSGPEAVALKLAKGGILGAAHIVLVERERELQAFRRAWRGLPEFPLHVLAPVAAVVRRPMDERRTFRETAFRRALEGAVECELDLGEIAISGARELEGPLPALPPGVLLGLNDGRGSLLSVGILLQMAPDSGKMTCLCRPEGARAAEVRIGRLLLNPDGTHSPLLA